LKQVVSVELPRPRGEHTKLDPAFHRLMAALRADLR
jgi:NitT/TauT family transport system ATP-binding protein